MKIGKHYYLKFYDHASTDNYDKRSDFPLDTIIDFVALLLGQNERYYYFELVKCSAPGNSLIWQVLKSTLIETKEVKL